MTVGNGPGGDPVAGLLKNIENRSYSVTGEKLVKHGFDPGFKKKRIYIYGHSGDPAHPNAVKERWLCATPPCEPQQPGTGYYNLVQDRINSDVRSNGYPAVFSSGTNAGKDAITTLNWNTENGAAVSDLHVSNLHLDWRAEPGPYAGIQMNYPMPSYPAGGVTPADVIPLNHIRYIHLKMRTTACKPPRSVEPYSSGRILYYISSYNDSMERPNGSKGLEVALGLQRFMSTPDRKWLEGGISAPGRARWECGHMNLFAHPTCGTSAVDVDAPSWGISKADDLNFWTSNSCNANFPTNQEFKDYVIDVPRLMLRLVDEGFMSVEYLKGAKYVGGILNGIELFGPAVIRSQVASHSIYKAEAPIDYGVVLGQMRNALGQSDPAFLAGTNDFVWRDTISIQGRCADHMVEGQFCDSKTEYGKVCSNGAQLLICSNSALRSGWAKLGSAEQCRQETTPGNRCTTLGSTCLNGEKIVACSDRPYTGQDWAPDVSKYMSASSSTGNTSAPQTAPQSAPQSAPGPIAPMPAPTEPAANTSATPSLAEGYHRMNNSGAKFYYNGTNAFCWFNANATPDGKPINPTSTSPQSVGARDAGQCNWDKVQ